MKILIAPYSNHGYLYPALAVGRELAGRGHDVQVVTGAPALWAVEEAGLPGAAVDDYGSPRALGVGRWFVAGAEQYRAIRQAAKDFGADAIVTSILGHGALLAGETLDLPVTVIGFAAHIWSYANDPEDRQTADRAWRLREILGRYEAAREAVGLPGTRGPARDTALVGAGLMLRGVEVLEVPHARLPDGVRHVGDCSWEPKPDPVAMARIEAWAGASDKPIAYVHLGRTFGGDSMWPALNAAFRAGPFRALVERGRSGPSAADPAADLLVVHHPWMSPLIGLAEVVVTNATSAPVLGALSRLRPLLVAPAGSEQPLLAEACLRSGVAASWPADPERAGAAIAALLASPAVASGVRGVQVDLAASPGPRAVADAVEASVSGRPSNRGPAS